MKRALLHYKVLMAFVIAIFTSSALADTQTLTIFGGIGDAGDVDPYTEASLDGGVTWQPAYLFKNHPWGNIPGTDSWINFDPSPFVGLNSSTLYRVRFNAPSEWSDPQMDVLLKADNQGIVSFNGEFVADIVGTASIDADLAFAANLRPGMNEIQIELIDWGGWVGFNYRIDLSVESDDPFGLIDSPSRVASDCSENAKNHGQFVSCIAHANNEGMKEGLITGKEKGQLQSTAAKTNKKNGKGK